MRAIFIILLFVSSQTINANFACGDLIYTSETSYSCDSPTLTESSLPNLPTGGKVIYIQADIKVSASCTGAANYYFITYTIDDPGSGSQVKLMSIFWDGNKRFTFSSQDSSGMKNVYIVDSTYPQYPDQWVSFSAWLDPYINDYSAVFTYTGPGGVPITVTPSYPGKWAIDLNPRIYPCADLGGADQTVCILTNFKVWYQRPTEHVQIADGTTPSLIARYNLNQYSGYVITDSAPNPLGPAYFGSLHFVIKDGSSTASGEDPVSANKPSWVPVLEAGTNKLMEYSGILFDQSSQYVTLPTFSLGVAVMTPVYSFTIKFWIKLSSSVSAYLFRYIKDSSTDIFCLGLEPDRTITVQIYNTATPNSIALSATDWNSVVITFTSVDFLDTTTFFAHYTLLINNSPGTTQTVSPGTRYLYDPSYTVRLGGPPTVQGIMAGVEIYSPGTSFMTAATSCQALTCIRDLGITTPSTCLLSICSVNCAVCFSNQDGSCLGCNSGYYLYEGQCTLYACEPGRYLDGSSTCQDCITNCERCSDSTTCDICDTGTVLDSNTNTCVSSASLCIDPAYFYYPSENSCKASCKYPFKVVSVSGSSVPYCILDINEADASQAQNVAKVATITNYATNFGGVVLGLLSSSNFGLLLMQSLAEMLSYIQYLNINYPPKVYLMLEQQNVNSGGLTIITQIPPQVAEAIPNHPLPEEFAKNDTYSSFVANSWDFLISLLWILLAIGLIWIFNPLFKRFTQIHWFFSKVLQSLKWNLFLGIFCSGYGFTAIFTALEFRTVNMGAALSILSFVSCLIINTLGFFAMYLVIMISVNFQTIKKTMKDREEQSKRREEVEESWKSYSALFEDYKNDHLSQKMFLFIFMIRTYIHYSILGYLNDYPFLQTCSFTVISIAMILYLIIRRPIKSKLNFAQQIVCEVAILVVNVAVLILAVMDKWVIGDNDERVRVGDVIVDTNFALSIVDSVFMVWETINQIKEVYSFIRKWLQRKRGLRNIGNILKRDLKKVSITHPNNSFNINTENLEISNLDKNHDASIDQLKPS